MEEGVVVQGLGWGLIRARWIDRVALQKHPQNPIK